MGLYIYDFFFEKQSSQFHEEDNQRTAERVEIPESQPCPKKQKTNNRPGSAGASGSKSGKIVAEGSIKSGGKHLSHSEYVSGAKIHASAPEKLVTGILTNNPLNSTLDPTKNRENKGKMNRASVDLTLNVEEVIPAATYEPSKDMNEGDFESKINSVLGDEAESSKTKDTHWFADSGSVITRDDSKLSTK